MAEFPKHTGGGYYELSNGEKVRGKEDAEAAEAALSGSSEAPSEAPSKGDGVPGQPTEPEKANLTEVEEEGLKIVLRAGRRTQTASSKSGIPTEPERGGVTAKDFHVLNPKAKEAKDAHPEVEKPKPADPPSITGNDGTPTEPDRGGVNKLERKLSGVQ